MKNKIVAILILVLFCGLGFFDNALAVQDNPRDKIGILVRPNPNHLSAKNWYIQNIGDKLASPQTIIVDGYEGIRIDNRTAYINAANIANNALYTNIYIISYNNDSEPATVDIFGQILKFWKFNVENLRPWMASGGLCQTIDEKKTCVKDADCSDNFVCQRKKGYCVKYCNLSSECPKDMYCDSEKARLIRDVKRLADFAEINDSLAEYNQAKNTYPSLPAGSYLPGKSISVWPSWNDTLGADLGYVLPVDPINKMAICGYNKPVNPGDKPSVATNFNTITCWDEVSKTFSTNFKNPVMPLGSFVYVYQYFKDVNSYQVCTNFETTYSGIPAEYRCDTAFVKPVTEYPTVKVGNSITGEGSFVTYFQVDTVNQADVDWSTVSITPVSPVTWGAWSGWIWDSGSTGLRFSTVSGISNQGRISAKRVVLGQAGYQSFKYRVKVFDVNGKYGEGEGNIRVCRARDCTGIECGKIGDNCGGTLICASCQVGYDCISNKCVKN